MISYIDTMSQYDKLYIIQFTYREAPMTLPIRK